MRLGEEMEFLAYGGLRLLDGALADEAARHDSLDDREQVFCAMMDFAREQLLPGLSACLSSLMSRAIFDAPMIWPSASLIGDTASEMSTSVPPWRLRTVS